MPNEIYTIEIHEFGNVREIPCYTCGHCTTIIALRAERTRPRSTCHACGRWICEKNEICNADCTPMYSLADDHFENAGKWGKYVPAIMQGATTIDEAEKADLIIKGA